MIKAERSGQLQSVQFLRGVAAFLVLLSHSVGGNFLSDANLFRHYAQYGRFGVQIFFIISGFIIPYAMYQNGYQIRDFRSFFFKRIIRIEPPYIISIVFVLLLNYSNTLSPWHEGRTFAIDWSNVLGHLGYLNAFTGKPWLNVVYWTLAIEFEFYIVMALVYPLITGGNKVLLFGIYFLLLATTFIPVPRSQLLPYLPFFLMGIALFLWKCDKVSSAEFLVLLIAASAVCWYKHGPLLLCLSYAVILCIHCIRQVPKMLLFFGTISYSLYLTHKMLITRFMGLADRLQPHLNTGVKLAMCLVFCLIIAYIYYRIFELPFIKMSKKIRYNRSEKQVKI